MDPARYLFGCSHTCRKPCELVSGDVCIADNMLFLRPIWGIAWVVPESDVEIDRFGGGFFPAIDLNDRC